MLVKHSIFWNVILASMVRSVVKLGHITAELIIFMIKEHNQPAPSLAMIEINVICAFITLWVSPLTGPAVSSKARFMAEAVKVTKLETPTYRCLQSISGQSPKKEWAQVDIPHADGVKHDDYFWYNRNNVVVNRRKIDNHIGTWSGEFHVICSLSLPVV